MMRPEDAGSWGEFHACLEREAADLGSPFTVLWWVVGVLCFVTALISSGYAMSATHVIWPLWAYTFAGLAVDGVLAAQAVKHADQRRTRRAELIELEDAWRRHLHRDEPSW
jgi:hypothetical protein